MMAPIVECAIILFTLIGTTSGQFLSGSPVDCAQEGAIIDPRTMISSNFPDEFTPCIKCVCLKGIVSCNDTDMECINQQRGIKKARAISMRPIKQTTTTTTTTTTPITTTTLAPSTRQTSTTMEPRVAATKYWHIVRHGNRVKVEVDDMPDEPSTPREKINDYDETTDTPDVSADLEGESQEEEEAPETTTTTTTRSPTRITKSPSTISVITSLRPSFVRETPSTTTKTIKPYTEQSTSTTTSTITPPTTSAATTTSSSTTTTSTARPSTTSTTTITAPPVTTTRASRVLEKVIKKKSKKFRSRKSETTDDNGIAQEVTVEDGHGPLINERAFVLAILVTFCTVLLLILYLIRLIVEILKDSRKVIERPPNCRTPARDMVDKYCFDV